MLSDLADKTKSKNPHASAHICKIRDQNCWGQIRAAPAACAFRLSVKKITH
jgi:hypothetical protein